MTISRMVSPVTVPTMLSWLPMGTANGNMSYSGYDSLIRSYISGTKQGLTCIVWKLGKRMGLSLLKCNVRKGGVVLYRRLRAYCTLITSKIP